MDTDHAFRNRAYLPGSADFPSAQASSASRPLTPRHLRRQMPAMARDGQLAGFVFSTAVLVVAGGFALYVHGSQTGFGEHRYGLSAQFISANGLDVGADVDMAGVTIGRVTGVALNTETAMADVKFQIDEQLHLPTDSVISIGSASLSGDDALMIEPGKATTAFAPGSTVTNTREPMSLEQQVSDYIFGSGGLPPD